jgi:hypothetical protein
MGSHAERFLRGVDVFTVDKPTVLKSGMEHGVAESYYKLAELKLR